MGVKVAALFAALGLDKKEYDRGLDQAESKSRGWGSRVGSIFKAGGKAIALGLGVGIAALGALGVAAAGNAVEQERATARVTATYGAAGAAVTQWAQDNSRALGINDDVLELSMAQYGDWAKNVGMSTDEAMAGGKEMVKRAQEISLATGKSFEEVFEGLFKGQQGMTRGLKTYGITIDDVALRNEALRQGWIKEGDALTTATAARARGNLILQQSSQFTKIATDMQGGLVQQQRVAAVVVDEAMDTIGTLFLNLAQVVLPVVVDAMIALSDWVQDNMPTIQAVFDTAVGVIAAVFRVLSEDVIPVVVGVLQTLFGAVQENGPTIGAIFEDVFAVVSGVIDVFINDVMPPLMAILAMVVDWIAENWPTISSVFGQVFGAIANVVKTVWPIVANIAKVLFPMVAAAATVLFRALDVAFKLIGGIFEVMGNVASTVWDAIVSVWEGAGDFFKGVWDGINTVVKGGVNFFLGIINGIIKAINSIQVHIPQIGIGPASVGPFDWNGLNLPRIPLLASGVRDWAGGWAMVGERGPELVNLPRGADVFSSAESRALAGRVGRVEVAIRDPDGALRQGGYSQSDLERAVTAGLRAMVGDMRHASSRS